MNRFIFDKVLTMIDKHQFTKPNTFVICDNCSAHILDTVTTSHYRKIKLVFLPPNVTYVFQPCDQQLFYSLEMLRLPRYKIK